jgi:hypothetical protein
MMSVGLSEAASERISSLVAEPSLIQVSGAAAAAGSSENRADLGDVQRARGQVFFLVGHEHEVAALVASSPISTVRLSA